MPALKSAWESICTSRSLEESLKTAENFSEYIKELVLPVEDEALFDKMMYDKLDKHMEDFRS